jgi:nitrogen-specific signal transduction histidine kinase/CheY-like chemotaxis protein
VDVTHRKNLEEQYRHAQKMEAVGQLAAGVAHDFNNLLTVISGYSELLMQRLPEKDPMRGPINSIHTAGQRAASLTQQLLAFSRKQVLEPKILDLNDIIVQTARMLQRLIGEDIRLASVLAPDLSRVRVDPSQVEQVLMNLAVNARDAMPKGGMITMETSNVVWDETQAEKRTNGKAGRYVMLTVSDTGHGMTPEVQARIFEPFFTTKGVGKGTGLGLATVFGIVAQSDGHIEVHSETGSGTSFRIYFPAVESAPTALEAAVHQIPKHGTESVLVVEDEEDLRPLIREVLEEFGYRLHIASCGSEALEMLAKMNEPIDLLLTDVVLPEMSGNNIAIRVRQKFPNVKVLYMSGYIADDVLRHGVVAEQVAFIHKPFSPLALANRVREVLDSEIHSKA